MMMAPFLWHGASNRASFTQQLIFLALVLNCPAVGISGSQREPVPARRVGTDEDQAEVIPSGYHSVRERMLGKIWPCLSFVKRRRQKGKEKGELTFTPKRSAGEDGGRGHYRTTCGHYSALGQPGMSWGAFLVFSLRRVRVLWCKGVPGSPDSSCYDKVVSAFM